MKKFKTRLNKALHWAGFALILSACSTTSGPEDLGELAHTEFSEKADGSAYHKIMGLSCPAAIGGMPRSQTHVYNDQGTDVSCNYVGNDRFFTLYFSHYPLFDLGQIFGDANAAIEQRFSSEGYEYDESLSDTCSSETLDTASILSGFSGILSGENTTNEITLSPSPSAVYTQGEKMTLVVVDEMFEKEFFKVRYTGPIDGESTVKNTCAIIRDTYLSVEKTVKEDRGIAVSKEDRLLNLINASEDR